MSDENKVPETGTKRSVLPWVLIGTLLLAIISGGIYIFVNSRTNASVNQSNPGAGRQQNPALQATMQLMRLQRDSQNALTSDQVAKVKPILQTLIDTASPSKDFLQQQADAINALLSEQQRTFLSAQGNSPRGNNANGSGGNPPNGGAPNGSGGPNGQGPQNGNGGGGNLQPQDMYKQVLDSLK
jgi:hypothetical protein